MKECTKCHKTLEDTAFSIKVKNGVTYSGYWCKECSKRTAHELYLRYKKDLLEKGSPKILHKKSPLLRKACTKCDIEKDIQDFPYDRARDCYSNICKSCSYKRSLRNKPFKKSNLTEKKALLAEGRQTCRFCKQIKPIKEMMAGQGTYIGTCRVCGLEQRHLKYGVPHKAKERKERGNVKRQRKQEWNNSLKQKRDLFAEGKRKCTKCGKILLLSNFAKKSNCPTKLQDYHAMCRKCGKQLYIKPYTAKYRLQKNMQEIISFINTDFTCELCGKVKAPYEMGIVNTKLCWCKECQLSQKRKQYRRKNRNAKNNPYRHLVNHMRKCLKDSLVGRKGHKTFVYLGCTGPELKIWLESQFTKGMSWDNRGIDGWHIDHYIPISYFDLSREEDRFICWNYRNLRPLWGTENVEKGDSLPDDYLQHIAKIKKELHFPFDNPQTK